MPFPRGVPRCLCRRKGARFACAMIVTAPSSSFPTVKRTFGTPLPDSRHVCVWTASKTSLSFRPCSVPHADIIERNVMAPFSSTLRPYGLLCLYRPNLTSWREIHFDVQLLGERERSVIRLSQNGYGVGTYSVARLVRCFSPCYTRENPNQSCWAQLFKVNSKR